MPLRALLGEQGDSGTTAEAVYRALRHGIVHGKLAPGERLRSDALANELRVSRTPVREALRMLEAEGLVEHAGPRLVVRALWLLYPLVMTFVIVVTANHFIVDALLGALTAGASAYGASWLARARPTVWRFSTASPAPVTVGG